MNAIFLQKTPTLRSKNALFWSHCGPPDLFLECAESRILETTRLMPPLGCCRRCGYGVLSTEGRGGWCRGRGRAPGPGSGLEGDDPRDWLEEAGDGGDSS